MNIDIRVLDRLTMLIIPYY